ncbi:hypothetical protein CSIM01_07071 [Colletotrichum simmondsii]|uniref:AIG1-type G domain-containing protein n=1 Tax=Colletotrichum simmondsii TaxID=703756 RepID=A0A135RT95_9PEZI|nr:hypothetical protein CSIM01_07071 [Colletotrichum simmondsii]
MKTLTIAVFGPKGCGKTTFIRSLFENAGDYVVAQDDDISIHTASLDEEDLQIHLIDTPGLFPDKRHLPDTKTLNYIKTRLVSMDRQIDGVIYLQRVMDLSNANYAVRSLEAFLNAFKSRRLRYAVVAATNWDRVTSEADSSALEGYFYDHLDREMASLLAVRIQRARLSDSTDASWDLLERYEVEKRVVFRLKGDPAAEYRQQILTELVSDGENIGEDHRVEESAEAPFERLAVQAPQYAS